MIRLLLLFAAILMLTAGVLRAGEDPEIAAARAADDLRVAALLAGNAAGLEAVLSNEFRYVHSSGHADNKASYLENIASRKTVYVGYDYQARNFQACATGVVLMTGHVLIHSLKGKKSGVDLDFLAVWRNEAGVWRLLAWQSTEHPPAPVH